MENLKKYKKNLSTGFQEYVLSLEIKSKKSLIDILIKNYLEDPIYTKWVEENLIGLDYFFTLNRDERQYVIKHFPNPLIVMLRALKNHAREFEIIDESFPQLACRQYRESRDIEMVTSNMQEEARSRIIEFIINCKKEGIFQSLKLKLPPDEILSGQHLSFAKNGIVTLFFDNGAIALHGEMENNYRQGEWIAYYPNQKVCAEGNYSSGQQEGEWSYYYSNGALKAKGLYVNGEKNNSWLESEFSGESFENLYQSGKLLKSKKVG